MKMMKDKKENSKVLNLYRYQGPIFKKDLETGRLKVISNHFSDYTHATTMRGAIAKLTVKARMKLGYTPNAGLVVIDPKRVELYISKEEQLSPIDTKNKKEKREYDKEYDIPDEYEDVFGKIDDSAKKGNLVKISKSTPKVKDEAIDEPVNQEYSLYNLFHTDDCVGAIIQCADDPNAYFVWHSGDLGNFDLDDDDTSDRVYVTHKVNVGNGYVYVGESDVLTKHDIELYGDKYYSYDEGLNQFKSE